MWYMSMYTNHLHSYICVVPESWFLFFSKTSQMSQFYHTFCLLLINRLTWFQVKMRSSCMAPYMWMAGISGTEEENSRVSKSLSKGKASIMVTNVLSSSGYFSRTCPWWVFAPYLSILSAVQIFNGGYNVLMWHHVSLVLIEVGTAIFRECFAFCSLFTKQNLMGTLQYNFFPN